MKKFLGVILGVVFHSSLSQAQVLVTRDLLEACGQEGSLVERIEDCDSIYFDPVNIIERSASEIYTWQLISMDPHGRQVWVESNSGLAVTSNNLDDRGKNAANSRSRGSVFLNEAIEGCSDPEKYPELKHGLDLNFRLPTKEDAEFLIRAKVNETFYSTPSKNLFRYTVRGSEDNNPVTISSLPSFSFISLWTQSLAQPTSFDQKKGWRRAFTFSPSGMKTLAPIDRHIGTWGTFTQQKLNFQKHSLFLCVAEVDTSEVPRIVIHP